jgi:hypothetical protein
MAYTAFFNLSFVAVKRKAEAVIFLTKRDLTAEFIQAIKL